jgi:hypothetical protein
MRSIRPVPFMLLAISFAACATVPQPRHDALHASANPAPELPARRAKGPWGAAQPVWSARVWACRRGVWHPRSYLEAQIIKAPGGRVAKEIVFGAEHVTGGAYGDLVHVNRIARRMIYRLGIAGNGSLLAHDGAGPG